MNVDEIIGQSSGKSSLLAAGGLPSIEHTKQTCVRENLF